MKVIIVCNSLDKGGIAKLLAHQARTFASLGADVHMVVLNGKVGAHALDFPLQLHQLDLSDSLAPKPAKIAYALARPAVRGLGNVFAAKHNASRVEKLLRDIDYHPGDDKLFIHGIRTILMLRKLNAPAATWILHYTKSEMLRNVGPLKAAVRKRIVRSSLAGRQLAAVSKAVADDVSRGFNLPRDRFHVIYNGVDVAHILRAAEEPFEHPRPYICSVGRIEAVKGYNYLLEAFASMGAESHDLVLVGGGDELDKLKAQARALGIADRVHFAGQQPNPYKYMKRAELFVMSSLGEGFPMVLLEALACGTPVVATTVGGIPELLENTPDRLAPAADVNRLAEAIQNALKSTTLDRNGASLLDPQFTVESCCRQYLALPSAE